MFSFLSSHLLVDLNNNNIVENKNIKRFNFEKEPFNYKLMRVKYSVFLMVKLNHISLHR